MLKAVRLKVHRVFFSVDLKTLNGVPSQVRYH